MSSSSPYKPITTSSSPPPSSTPLSANLDFISSRRPWRQFFDRHSLSFPHHFSDAFSRLKTNFSYFRMNFAMIVLLILFVSLLWHPISLIVFLIMMVAWLFLYFLRDEPLVLFGRSIDDRIILAVLSVLTVGFLLLTGATGNILIALAVGVGVIVIYSVFRRSDDLFLDEEQAAAGGLLAGRTGI
ncbi:PRA1 family protein F3-like [Chenopodium quinoa]|uniref:PRA1 family protein F3-like n=1 Tax=Chenopodium quinoa TaxID=63459 RepID=UPI000B788A05|nr:PRA1 family protein F3-like [Chenopodium quinoa]